MRSAWYLLVGLLLCTPTLSLADEFEAQSRQLKSEVKTLDQRVRSVLSELKTSLRGQNLKDPASIAVLDKIVSSLSFRIADIQEDESELRQRVDTFAAKDPKIARSEEIKRSLLRQGLLRRKIAKAIQKLEKKIQLATERGQELVITGEIDLGFGQDTLRASGKTNTSTRSRVEATANSRFNKDITASAKIAHNEKTVFTQFRTQDFDANVDWKVTNSLTIRPKYEQTKYKDLQNNTQNYDKSGIIADVFYDVNEQLKVSANHSSYDWNYAKKENFKTVNMAPKFNYKWDDQNIELSYIQFGRENQTTKTGDFTTAGPSIKYLSGQGEDENWSLSLKQEKTEYAKNKKANNDVTSALFALASVEDNGESKNTEISYQNSNYPSDASLKFTEYGVNIVKTKYDAENGFSMNQNQYYYRSFNDKSLFDTIDINSLSNQSVGTFFGNPATGSNQNIFHFTLVDKSPRSGEQSWELIFRREMSFNLDNSKTKIRLGPLLGHKMNIDLSAVETAKALENAGGPEADETKVLLENPLNYYRFGGRLSASMTAEPVFVNKGSSSISLNLSLDHRVFYFAKPNSSIDSILAAVRFSTPIPYELSLSGELSYSKSLSKTEGAQEITKDLTTMFVSISIPYEERISQ